MNEVIALTGYEMQELINNHENGKKIPKERFISGYDGRFTSLDNSTGECWVESFSSYTACLLWVRG